MVINPAVDLDYAFSLTVGDYAFIASTDLDGDGVLCEDGEYCGAWPVLGDPYSVSVFEGLTLTHIDFQLVRISGVGTLQVGGRTVRLTR